MSYETLRNVHRNRFDVEVATPNGYLVQYDNYTIDVPQDGLWITWNVLEGTRTKVQMSTAGGGTYRTPGVCKANVFVPIKTGDKTALEAADLIATAFRAVTDSGVVYRTPSVSSGRRDGKWWFITVTCPWYFDEVL